jgi:hypothetical protein
MKRLTLTAALAVLAAPLAACLPPLSAGPAQTQPTTALASTQATTAPTTAPTLVIGSWMQPIESFAKWRARGVNTLIGAANGPADPDRAKWRAAARDAGLYYFDWPTDPTLKDMSVDAADDHLLALMQPDEPDDKDVPIETLRANYEAFKRAGKPTYLGFDLWQFQWQKV